MEPASPITLPASRPLTSRRRFPGAQFLRSLENRLWQSLRERMQRADTTPPQDALPHAAMTGPIQRWQELMTLAQEQAREAAEAAFFLSILDRLQPDQLRILSALADGSSYPAVQLLALSRFGTAGQVVLDGLSSVSKAAGVQCQDWAPHLLVQLRTLGLVQLAPWPQPDQVMKYEMLETEAALREWQNQLKAQGIKTRVLRQSLYISPLGRRLLAACHPDH